MSQPSATIPNKISKNQGYHMGTISSLSKVMSLFLDLDDEEILESTIEDMKRMTQDKGLSSKEAPPPLVPPPRACLNYTHLPNYAHLPR